MANINLYESRTCAFLLVLSVFQILYDFHKYFGNYLTSYLTAIVMFPLSLNVYEIFANQEKCQIDLENEGQGVEERNLRHSTRNVRIPIGDFSEF